MSVVVPLGEGAAAEWAGLVTTAIVGTDRRPAPPPAPGWDTWSRATDPAVALLDRALAVVLARRAGACPTPAVGQALAVAPADQRPPCPQPCAHRMRRLLAGEHDALLAEWFQLCGQLGAQLPAELLPALLLRGRRNPELDVAVRHLAGARAAWLAGEVPELGIPVTGPPAAAPPALVPPAPLADSGAAVTAVVQLFRDHAATWAAAPQLRAVVVALHPSWLPALIGELSRLPFVTTTERTRAELLSLAEVRMAMVQEFVAAATTPVNESDAP